LRGSELFPIMRRCSFDEFPIVEIPDRISRPVGCIDLIDLFHHGFFSYCDLWAFTIAQKTITIKTMTPMNPQNAVKIILILLSEFDTAFIITVRIPIKRPATPIIKKTIKRGTMLASSLNFLIRIPSRNPLTLSRGSRFDIAGSARK